MQKSADAFRTISEVAEWLDTPTHVLRFWESKFSQIKPVKRAGGRRYYRPKDMLLIGGIKRILHDDGMTIKGAQKLLKEQGIKHVSSLSQPLADDIDLDDDHIEDMTAQGPETPPVSNDVTQSALLDTPAPIHEPDEQPTEPAELQPPEDIQEQSPENAPEPVENIADVIPLHAEPPAPVKARPSLFKEDEGQLNFWAEDIKEDPPTETFASNAQTALPKAEYQSLLDYLTAQPLSALQKQNIAPVIIQMHKFLEKNGK